MVPCGTGTRCREPVSLSQAGKAPSLRLLNLHDHRLPISLAPFRKPIAHRPRQPLWINPQSCLQSPVSRGQRIVEFRRARKIPHAKAIEPIERHRSPFSRDRNLGLQLSSVHAPQYIRMIFAARTNATAIEITAAMGSLLFATERFESKSRTRSPLAALLAP